MVIEIEPETPAVEVQPNLDGDTMEVTSTVPISEGEAPPTAELANGIEGPQLQVQDQIQVPEIYNMDLEIMHKELYKNSYLTPNDFLDDIHKIVHNATVFANQDTDRHNRALAMLTAAQVSLQDFDPQLRIDYQYGIG